MMVGSSQSSRPIAKGTPPKGEAKWHASVWFVLPDRTKEKHSCVVVASIWTLVDAIGELIDGLEAEHGATVRSVGWTAISRGK